MFFFKLQYFSIEILKKVSIQKNMNNYNYKCIEMLD